MTAASSIATAVERVHRLIRLATDPAASEQEARTSAVIACRTIRAHGLMVVAEQPCPAPQPRRDHPPPPPWRRIIRARYSGYCVYCGVYWDEGDKIAWSQEARATCVDCREAPPW